MKTSNPIGPFATNGAELPLHEVFAQLRARWILRFRTTSNSLAERLSVRPQSIAQWATGSDPTKRPPLWALAALADDLRVGLLLTGDGIEVVRRRKKRGPGLVERQDEGADDLDGGAVPAHSSDRRRLLR